MVNYLGKQNAAVPSPGDSAKLNVCNVSEGKHIEKHYLSVYLMIRCWCGGLEHDVSPDPPQLNVPEF